MGWFGNDLVLDDEAFLQASKELAAKCEELGRLHTNLVCTFEQLRTDWDTDAGKIFFQRFDDDLLKNLDKYTLVFEHMSKNLSTALQKYEEVFRAADTVADAQY